MEWSNKVTMEFLDLYEKEPVIWNPNLKHHKDRSQVYDAWKRIRSALSIECSLNELKKKKETLMATYRKLSIRVKKSRREGNGSNNLYEPIWFAYDKMASFLDNIYIPRVPIATETVTPQNGNNSEEDYLQYPEDEPTFNDQVETSGQSFLLHGIESNDAVAMETTASGLPPVAKKRKLLHAGHIEKRMNEAYHILKQVAAKPKEEKDETSMFCDLLCSKLKALDEDTRDIAMHEINNLMFGLKKQPNIPFQSTYQQPSYVHVGHTIKQSNSPEYGTSPMHSPYDTISSPQHGPSDNRKEESCENEEGC